MNKLRTFFSLLGAALIGYWMFRTSTQIKTGSFKEFSETTYNHRYLALIGMSCFWVYPVINWIKSEKDMNYEVIVDAVKEQLFPSFGRKMPVWIQLIRVIAGAAFMYFMLTSVRIVDDELEFEFRNIIFIILGVIIFFILPYFFPPKDSHDT